MARMARLVVPGAPHHITQRGNRRQPTFFNIGDYVRYLEIAAEAFAAAEVEVWSYCLSTTGRPLGAAAWIKALEQTEGRTLSEPKRGRPSQTNTTLKDGGAVSPPATCLRSAQEPLRADVVTAPASLAGDAHC